MKIQRVILSPHFDDACLSAFDVMTPSTLLVTVCGGEPKTVSTCRWDTACGFTDSHDAVVGRKKENARAAKMIGCPVLDLPFPDHQYDEWVDPQELQLALLAVFLANPHASFIVPYAVGGHFDHDMVKQIMARLARSMAPSVLTRWSYYADLPYALGDTRFLWKKVRDPKKKWQTAIVYRSQIDAMQMEYPEWNEDAFAYESLFPYTI